MKKKKILIAAAIAALAFILFVIFNTTKEAKIYATSANNIGYYDSNYQAYLDKHHFNNILSDNEVVIDLREYKASNGMSVYEDEEGIITDDIGSITWDFYVEEEGFYNLEVGYMALPGTTSDIQRKLYINDELCHEGLNQIVLKRLWSDDIITEKNGNEIRPNTYEVYQNLKVYIEDYQRRVGEPYIFYLNQGMNSVTFEVTKEPVVYTSLIFKKAESARSYKDSITSLKQSYPLYDGESLVYQAERKDGETLNVIKSSSSINIQKNYSSSFITPYHPYKTLYNTIGADSWKQPGNFITWEIDVPKEGLYQIAFKGRQSLKRGVTAYRRLRINGEVPYAEMNSVGFEYRGTITNYILTDENGDPVLFYLKSGVNTISLECVMGDLGGIISEVEESMYQLNQAYLRVIQITGQVPDRFIDYEIVKKVPEFATIMKEESERLFNMVNQLVEITGEKGENTTLLEKMAIQAEGLAKDPEDAPNEIGQLKNNIAALGTWLVNISEMPLELDAIQLFSPNKELSVSKISFLKKTYYSTIRFLSTFFVKSTEVTSSEDEGADKSLKVWMVTAAGVAGQSTSGREQAQIIQNMIDEVFTPTYGISVKLELIPAEVILRAALAGNAPDMVIGLSQATLQDFAMRNAVVDLSAMEDFTKATERFYQSTIDSASYQGKVYGLPEQAMFMMLFCRNDILEKIGAKVPTTWRELREILPLLQKYNYALYLPTTSTGPSLASSIIFQYGGNLFKGSGEDYGIESALDEDVAMLAFKEYTDLFTSYGLEVNVDFTNRFRTGIMPIGITNYNTYNQLEIFAPEIKGQWTFYPLPGIEKEDGTIDNTYVVDTVQSAILNSSNKKEDAWELLKWWTGTQTQLTYANTVESVMGTAARYPAADPEVLKQLPWSNQELINLMKQFESTIGIEAIPGYYMSARMVQYSFDKVVAEMANPRETLYLNIKSINKELTKKREEFHLSVID